MKNALILHGTDFANTHKQRFGNWFPWLKSELEIKGCDVFLPELPEANHPTIERYWQFLHQFDFNSETLIVGHSSGAAAIFGLLNKLPSGKKVKTAISVAGFYKDEGWNCEGLFREELDWEKIKKQSERIELVYSDNDPYVQPYHAEYLGKQLGVLPLLFKGKKHFNLEAGEQFKEFPEILTLL